MQARLYYPTAYYEKEYVTFSNGKKGYFINRWTSSIYLAFELPKSLEGLKIGIECDDWKEIDHNYDTLLKKIDEIKEWDFDYIEFWDDRSMPETGEGEMYTSYLKDGTPFDFDSIGLDFENDGYCEIMVFFAEGEPDFFELEYEDGTIEGFYEKEGFLAVVEDLCKNL